MIKRLSAVNKGSENVIKGPTGPSITLANNKKILNFCSNNYLALSNHPHVVESAIKYTKSHGAGLSSVRFIAGTQDIHKELENRISLLHNTEDTVLFPSCFDANAGLFEALLTGNDSVVSDSLNHASIIDGIRLCKAKRFRYKHNNNEDLLENWNKATTETDGLSVLVSDGVFSMDGDIAPVDKLVDLVMKNNDEGKKVLFLDECHATGVLGETGRGTLEHFGLMKDNVSPKLKEFLKYNTIINSTLGKALGGASGGYTTGSANLISLLRQKARPYLFSNTIAPGVVGAAMGALDVLSTEGPQLLTKLRNNAKLFRFEMQRNGFTLSGADHSIIPVMLFKESLAKDFSTRMIQEGVFVIGFCYPVVPINQARIRVQMSAGHDEADILKAVEIFRKVGKEFQLI